MLPTESATRDGRPLVLRRATAEDAEALVAAVDAVSRERAYLLRSRFHQPIEDEREFLARAAEEGRLVLLADVEGRLAGWVTLGRPRQDYRRHCAELGIGVLAEWRGVGVGRALMEAAIAWSAAQGLERLELGVRASNHRAQRLYERLGFVEEGRARRAVKDEDGRYDDVIAMARFL